MVDTVNALATPPAAEFMLTLMLHASMKSSLLNSHKKYQ